MWHRGCLLCVQCPVFLLFLDCVSQLRRLFPGSFQFSDIYLVHIWDALNSRMFGTFAYNSPHDRCVNNVRTDESMSIAASSPLLPYLLASVWDWSQQFSDAQISLMYDPLYTASCDLSIMSSITNGRKSSQPGLTVTEDGCHQLQLKLHDVRLWSLCYLRWLTPLMIIGGGPACEYLTQCLVIEEIGQLRQEITELEQATEVGAADKRRSVLIFGSSAAAAAAASTSSDLMDSSPASVVSGLTQHVSSSFPFVLRHLSVSSAQVPSIDTYVESSLLAADFGLLAVTDNSTSTSFCEDANSIGDVWCEIVTSNSVIQC